MNIRSSINSVVLICAGAFAVLGQDRPQPTLFDEFEKTGCELLLSKLDSFFSEITNQAASTGTIVIYGDSSNMSKSFEYEAWITGNIAFRNFPQDKLTIIRRLSSNPKLQFWTIPNGANNSFPGEEWSLTLPSRTRPFIFWQSDDSGCPGNSLNRYAQVLSANPNASANIVLRGSNSEIRKTRKELVSQFVHELGIARSRLRFYSVRTNNHLGFADYELWFVP